MTTQEKARELYFLYSQEVRGIFYRKSRIKRCALVAVDEILNISYFTCDPSEDDCLYMNYWKQVKQEIEKL